MRNDHVLWMQMTVSRGIRVEVSARGRKVPVPLPCGHYSGMEIKHSLCFSRRGKSAASRGWEARCCCCCCCCACVPHTETSHWSTGLSVELHRKWLFSPAWARFGSACESHLLSTDPPRKGCREMLIRDSYFPSTRGWYSSHVGKWWSLKCPKILYLAVYNM